MGQYFNNSENDFLWTLLANPANDAHVHIYDLQQLVNEFPQSGILQALLVHASDEKNLKQASVYFNPGSLYKLLNAPLTLIGVSDERIIIEPGIRSNSYHQNDEYLPETEDTDVLPEISPELNDSENYFNEQSETVQGADDHEQEYDHYAVIHEEAELPVNDEEADNYYFTETEADEIAVEGVVETEAAETPASLISESEPEVAANVTEESPIDEELIDVYEAMSSRIKSALEGQAITNDGNAGQAEPIEAGKEIPQEQPLITAEYVHIDEHEEKQPDIEAAVDPEPKDAPLSAEQGVSMYHDEKMPYTFMWWLDKTRREHSGVFQPYAKVENINPDNKQKNTAHELQQQYFENIFHITSVEELDKSTAPPAPNGKLDIKQKEQIIIQRFIEEEPQIRPQSSDKLDNENKARKSSEDHDELVTETLAEIYSDQMLYHKAIASYKKLMLKFPEKSRYFAGKIEQLEKKIN